MQFTVYCIFQSFILPPTYTSKLAILNFANVTHHITHYRSTVSNHFQFSWIMRKEWLLGFRTFDRRAVTYRSSTSRLIGYRLSNKVFITGRENIDQNLISDGSIIWMINTTNWFCIDQSIQSPMVPPKTVCIQCKFRSEIWDQSERI
jgi:hypothetical protein